MSEYVSRILLEVNGQQIDDFDSVEEKEVEIRKPVKLMNGSGSCDVTPHYAVTVDYVIPKDKDEFDFKSVADGTLVIDRQNGTRIEFSGVYCLKVGQVKYDGENAAKRSIELMATDKTP